MTEPINPAHLFRRVDMLVRGLRDQGREDQGPVAVLLAERDAPAILTTVTYMADEPRGADRICGVPVHAVKRLGTSSLLFPDGRTEAV